MNIAKQDTMSLGSDLHNKAEQGNPVGGKGSQEQAKESETLLLPLLGVPQNP